MHKTNSIIMHAPKMSIFETAANLELWPKILPHYRYIHYLERSPNRNLVVMAARRDKSLLQEMLLGSVAYKVVRTAPCNVMLVK